MESAKGVGTRMGQGRKCTKMASALRSESVEGGDLSRLVAQSRSTVPGMNISLA